MNEALLVVLGFILCLIGVLTGNVLTRYSMKTLHHREKRCCNDSSKSTSPYAHIPPPPKPLKKDT